MFCSVEPAISKIQKLKQPIDHDSVANFFKVKTDSVEKILVSVVYQKQIITYKMQHFTVTIVIFLFNGSKQAHFGHSD